MLWVGILKSSLPLDVPTLSSRNFHQRTCRDWFGFPGLHCICCDKWEEEIWKWFSHLSPSSAWWVHVVLMGYWYGRHWLWQALGRAVESLIFNLFIFSVWSVWHGVSKNLKGYWETKIPDFIVSALLAAIKMAMTMIVFLYEKYQQIREG